MNALVAGDVQDREGRTNQRPDVSFEPAALVDEGEDRAVVERVAVAVAQRRAGG
jgi:hypothetical protein